MGRPWSTGSAAPGPCGPAIAVHAANTDFPPTRWPESPRVLWLIRSGGLAPAEPLTRQPCTDNPGAVCLHKHCQELASFRFARVWLDRLKVLMAAMADAAADWRLVGVGDHCSALAAAARRLLDLACHLVMKMADADVEEYMAFTKDLLDFTTAPDSNRWREHLQDEASTEFEELLAQLFTAYFEMLRRVGWHLKPELRPESWLEKPSITLGRRLELSADGSLPTDAQHRLLKRTSPVVYTTAGFVAARKETLSQEWQFAQGLLTKTQLSKQQRSAVAKVFSDGMLRLARALLRDASLICEHHAGRSEYKNLCTIAPQVMRDYLLGDLAFTRRACEHVQLAAAYEVLRGPRLVSQLAQSGFRAIRLTKDSLPGGKKLSWDHSTEDGTKSPGGSKLWRPRNASAGTSLATATARRTSQSERVMDVKSVDQLSPFSVRKQEQRMLLVPPGVTESQVKALLEAVGGRESIPGYVVLVDPALPGLDEIEWSQLERCHWGDNISNSRLYNPLTFNVILEAGCATVVAASKTRLLEECHKLELCAGAARRSPNGTIRRVVEQMVALEQTRMQHAEIHQAVLAVAHSLLEEAQAATEEADGIWEVEEDAWATAFQYCKDASAFNLLAVDSTKLVQAGLKAAQAYDQTKARMRADEERDISQASRGRLKIAAVAQLKGKVARIRRKAVYANAAAAAGDSGQNTPRNPRRKAPHNGSRRFSAPGAGELSELGGGTVDMSLFETQSDEESESDSSPGDLPCLHALFHCLHVLVSLPFVPFHCLLVLVSLPFRAVSLPFIAVSPPCIALSLPFIVAPCYLTAFPCCLAAFPCCATTIPCCATAFPCRLTAFPCCATAQAGMPVKTGWPQPRWGTSSHRSRRSRTGRTRRTAVGWTAARRAEAAR